MIIILLFCPMQNIGQNLIPNYSFEDTVDVKVTPLYALKYWRAVGDEGWNYLTPLHNQEYPNWGAPNNQNGYQLARTGNSYIGINLDDFYTTPRRLRREYIQVKLNRALMLDSTYCMRMYMSLADSAHFASKGQLGVYFSNNGFTVNHAHNLPYTPQLIVSPNEYVNDKINWMEFNMQYKATGGERYITIGNFNDTTSIDTQYVAGGGNQFWQLATYYYIDDVWLSHCDSLPPEVGIPEKKVENKLQLFPNPTSGSLSIETNNKLENISIYNVQGQLVKELKQAPKQIELPESNGVYFLRIALENGEIVNRKVVKY